MSRAILIEKLASEQSSKSKLVFKNGSPADIPTDCVMDFVCLAGIDKYQIELAEVFSKVEQILRPGGQCCLLIASNLDSFIYYGMEKGFDFIKSETIETMGAMQFPARNNPRGTSALLFTFFGPDRGAERESRIFADGKKKITGIWFLRS